MVQSTLQQRKLKTLREQIKAVEREIALRKNVYPRLIQDNRMTVAVADHEIECMQSVLATLREVEQPELL